MISDTGSRLAVAAALLSFQTVIFVIEIMVVAIRSVIKVTLQIKHGKLDIHLSTARSPKLLTLLHHLAAPLSIGLLGAILIPIAFAASSREYPAMSATSKCDIELDADIGGDGIRIAIWVQEAVLILVAILGTFHSSATGAKEIGAGLAITHISLAIALLVQMSRATLSSVDAIFGAMILDSQNSALSIQFVSKETLAARWQVCVIILCQMFGLAVQPIFVVGFGRGAYATGNCRCLSVFWWAWLSNCSAASSREISVFWTYYACRVTAFAQCSFHSLNDTWKFHAAEKYKEPLRGISYPKLETGTANRRQNRQAENQQDENQKHEGSQAETRQEENHNQDENQIRNRDENHNQDQNHDQDQNRNQDQAHGQDQNRQTQNLVRTPSPLPAWEPREMEEDELRYHDYPATITLTYTVYGVFALASMSAVETAMRDLGLHPSSQVFSVGQIIAIVVAAATTIRAAYLFWGLFFAQWNKFVWPFSLGVAKEVVVGVRRRTYMLLPPAPETSAGCPFFPAPDESLVRIGNILRDRESVYKPVKVEDGINDDVAASSTRGFSFGIPARMDSQGKVTKFSFTMDELESVSFTPSPRQLAECMKDRRVSQALKQGSVYIITGLKIARGLEITMKEIKEKGFRLRVQIPKYDMDVNQASSTSEGVTMKQYQNAAVIAYRLHPLRRKLWRPSEAVLGPPLESKDAVL